MFWARVPRGSRLIGCLGYLEAGGYIIQFPSGSLYNISAAGTKRDIGLLPTLALRQTTV